MNESNCNFHNFFLLKSQIAHYHLRKDFALCYKKETRTRIFFLITLIFFYSSYYFTSTHTWFHLQHYLILCCRCLLFSLYSNPRVNECLYKCIVTLKESPLIFLMFTSFIKYFFMFDISSYSWDMRKYIYICEIRDGVFALYWISLMKYFCWEDHANTNFFSTFNNSNY